MSTVPLSVALFDELIMRGNYRFQHDHITAANFPDVNQVFYNPRLIGILSIEKEMPTDWVLKLIRKKACYPATIYHLLHYAAANPDLPMPLPIIALGTVFPYIEPEFAKAHKPIPHCAVLQDTSYRRGINITDTQVNKWGKGCSFLTYTV